MEGSIFARPTISLVRPFRVPRIWCLLTLRPGFRLQDRLGKQERRLYGGHLSFRYHATVMENIATNGG